MAILTDAQNVKFDSPGGVYNPPTGGDYVPPPPEIVPVVDPTPDPIPPIDSTPIDSINPSIQDLYGEGVSDVTPTATGPIAPTVADPIGADVIGSDPGVAEVGTPGQTVAPTVATPGGAGVQISDPTVAEVGTPGAAIADPTGAISQAAGVAAEQTDLTSEQQVDAELARILGQDSPLLARARQEAARVANRRGLQNTSIAAGMATGAMVDRALPMAQQTSAQAFQREMANTALRQQATTFTASEQNRLSALEAELGTSVSVFNADQLNQAESLSAQMRTALEQQDTDSYNRASMQLAELQRSAQEQQSQLLFQSGVFNAEQLNQAEALSAQMRTALEQQDVDAANRASLQLAELQRSAQAQQADIGFAAEQQRSAEQQAYNQQIIDRVSQLNEQYLRGTQAMDLATIQGTYQQIISTNTTAASLYQSYFNGIAGVMDNPDMTPSQIASAVSNMQQMLEASLRMVSEMNNMDFGDIGATLPGGEGGGGGGGGGGRRGR